MTAPRKRLAIAALAAAGGAAALALALRPASVPVELATATRARLQVTVEGPGRTRVRERYLVAAPVPGHLLRLAVAAGDAVQAGDVVARIVATAPAPLDARTRAELRGRLAAARGAEALAGRTLERARHAGALARAAQERARALARGGSLAPRELEEAETAAAERGHELEMAEAAVRQARGETEAAAAALAAGGGPGAAPVEVRAPAAGRVLRVLQESESPLPAGAPLLELGDPARLEARVDLLSSEAVRVGPGAPVEVRHWGGDGALRGTVRRVEPAAFTKVSALGVEEQRVYVLVDPVGPGWQGLGDGFALDAAVIVSDREGVTQVPAAALFRQRDGWALFAVEAGRARLRAVRTGAAGEAAVEIVEGVAPGDRVIVHPSDRLADGVRVEAP
ncbi:efflux RND transporter periplasmic adaptor subunit [Anaeromyxobacter diazotrophicus]|uniref:RND transporter n=1 Tax=Anaeromyxobacter diazotrophicus TaxID=2590199 RepID=A0A7I9VNU4_9BACT|nr:HlyD family efflux transporter periplasmic adaptor subunit [Anaeromyxobacter diazotrophicus]GEJ58082.1 RND transporter [Anaeromyxobacter diazotrophicus]